ncbi:D-alanine--D-alanine ligase [Acetobacteraceae bacterium ESL0709]|nr:D-alanine--D-alanine ligase [Acetobacteraceae bacterium ESL0697]MDF7678387.1 D-alanine--D-alanine ligase [Acetobacteraceae bacterium ESL0709]
MNHVTQDKKQSSRLKIAIIMGGTSNERDVSLSSGKAVSQALASFGHQVQAIDVGADIERTIEALGQFKPDVVFNALHGPGGEDGTIQGVLHWMGLPYTHSDVHASAIAMNKATSRIIFKAHDLPVAKGLVITPEELEKADPFPRPYVIKPLLEGSSVGVTIMRPDDPARAKIARSWRYGKQILVEDYIPGQELTVSVMRDTPLAVTEILPLTGKFYDFGAKYQSGGSRHIVPASLPVSLSQTLCDLAVKAHMVLGCAGASRTDFRHDPETGRIAILEVNTQPGMTPTSLLPEQAAYRGLSYAQLCDWLVKEALSLNSSPVSDLLKTGQKG